MLQGRAIFILGMHRSGTSALARAVHLQGAVLPKTLMPAQADNPDGFWESLPIVQYNNSLLQDAGRSWDDPRPIDSSWWKQPGKRLQRVERAKQLLQSEFPDGDLIVLKDPRISRLLPVWLDAFKESGIPPSVLLCFRNPLEVAASLAERNAIDLQRAQLLWLSYMLEAEAATRGLPRAIIHYDTLLTDWRDSLSHAYDAIGLDSLSLSGEGAEAIDRFISADKRHHQVSTEHLLRDERLSPLLKATWTAFQTRPLPVEKTFDGLRERLADAWATMAPGGTQTKAEITKSENLEKVMTSTSQQSRSNPSKAHRHVILHYHLFKNAGTSLDHVLKQNFKDGWHEHEGPGPGWRAEDVTEYLIQHPEILVLSSHTALLPPPALPNTTVYPVIFIRHPIDRIRSIYEFERKQIADTEGARMAKQTDMAGYIKSRLNRKGDRSIRNFQAYRLAFAVPEMQDGKKLSEEQRALKAIEILPFVGVVEQFDESLTRLEAWLKPVFPHIAFKPTKANVTQSAGMSLEARLSTLENEIGLEIYEELKKANGLDLILYEAVANLKRCNDK